jgi:hypothetical protein
MLLLLRRCTTWRVAQIAGAVSFAYSPYVLANLSSGHFHQTVVGFIPAALLVLVDAGSGRRSPRWSGLALAGLVIAQYFTGAELLAMVALVGAPTALVAALVWREAVRRVGGRLLRTAAVASVVTAVVLAVPLWFEFFGPRHTTGKVWGEGFDLGVPLRGMLLAPLGFGHRGSGAALGLVGVGLLAAVAVGLVRYATDRRIVTASIAGGIALVFAFGSTLRLNLADLGTFQQMPWRAVAHVPVLEQLIPGRLVLLCTFSWTIVAVLALDRLRGSGTDAERRHVARSVVALVAVFAPTVLSAPVPIPSTTALYNPPWFARYGAHPGPNARLLVLPYPNSGIQSEPMLLQAQAGFSYSLVGGYVLVPTTGSTASAWRVPPTGAEGALIDFGSVSAMRWLSPAQRSAIATTMVERRVTTLVLLPSFSGNQIAEAQLADVMGARPRIEGGVLIWRDATHPHPLHRSDAALHACAEGPHHVFPAQVVACVLHGAAP